MNARRGGDDVGTHSALTEKSGSVCMCWGSMRNGVSIAQQATMKGVVGVGSYFLRYLKSFMTTIVMPGEEKEEERIERKGREGAGKS